MRVPTQASLLAAAPLRAQVSAGAATDLSAAERAALMMDGQPSNASAVPGVTVYSDRVTCLVMCADRKAAAG